MLQQAAAHRDVPPDVMAKFKARAEELIREGAVGFGEMTAEHFNGSTPYQSVAPDHPLLLALADIAAAHRATIDLHLEAVPQEMALPHLLKSPPNPPQLHESIAAFERLLSHNPKAAIIWAHAGSDNTGFRTPDLCRRLLQAHPNLYMEIKVDPVDPGLTPPLVNGATGAIRPDWLKLYQDFPDRFLVGTDQHYPEPKAAAQRWQAVVLLLNQLPAGLREKIAYENPRRLYPKLK
jgi:predicted TIM-barrel fold metal-dependent hydrolase